MVTLDLRLTSPEKLIFAKKIRDNKEKFEWINLYSMNTDVIKGSNWSKYVGRYKSHVDSNKTSISWPGNLLNLHSMLDRRKAYCTIEFASPFDYQLT